MSDNQNKQELANENENKNENSNDINNINNINNINEIEPEVKEKKEKAEKWYAALIKPALILGILTFMSALVLSMLNLLTAPVIADRLQSEKAESVKSLFGGDIIAEELQGYEDLYINYPAQVLEILYIRDKANHNPIGYCVTVSPKGFNGGIDMIAAVNLNCTIIDTAILSMSETAGSGTKIGDDSFKEQFKNKTQNIKANEVNNANSIDTIANATVSSKAFLNGVNTALAVINDILNLNPESIVDTVDTIDTVDTVEPVGLIPDETETAEDISETENIEDITEETAVGENGEGE